MSQYHFIAIGGAVMHNLALELRALGHEISGSDDEIFEPAFSRLEQAGLCPPQFGWFPEKIGSHLDGVILGMHAKLDNPELQKAQKLGVPIFSFPAFIREHAQNKIRVVLAGSHGKTTCTAMLMHILQKEGKEFDYLVGSIINGYDRMVRLTNAPIMVIEGDEYLSSPIDLRSKFLHYAPHFALITGVAWDHINVFPTLNSYFDTFEQFIATVTKACLYYSKDTELIRMCAKHPHAIGYEAPLHERSNSGTRVHGKNSDSIWVPFFGAHNIENAAGVVALAMQLGIPESQAWKHLADFPGTSKRLECIQKEGAEIIFRDFAHAPSKAAATISAVRSQFPERKLLSVFELHTYSSLQPEFMESYKGLFDVAEEAWVLYDPHVFELKKMPVPPAEVIQERLGNVRLFNNLEVLEEALLEFRTTAKSQNENWVSLWMSSGNFGGLKIV